MSTLYYGKYRAQVVDVNDPEKRGRIQVKCPRVLGDSKSAWCEPCVPIATDNYGDFCLPPVGEMIWVEFERGNPSKPIYTGGWYSKEKTPIKDYSKSPEERIISFKNSIISLKEDKIQISTKDESITVDLTKDLLTVQKDNSKVTVQKDSVIALNGTSSVTVQDGSVVISSGGTSCSFTSGSLATLKTLIGG